MPIIKKISKYNIVITTNTPSPNEISMALFDDNNKVFGHLLFVREGDSLPDAYERDGIIGVYYRHEQFPYIHNLLMYEQPVFINYSNPKRAYIFTGPEPTGEQEL